MNRTLQQSSHATASAFYKSLDDWAIDLKDPSLQKGEEKRLMLDVLPEEAFTRLADRTHGAEQDERRLPSANAMSCTTRTRVHNTWKYVLKYVLNYELNISEIFSSLCIHM